MFYDKTSSKTFGVALSTKVIKTEKYKQGNKSYEERTSETVSIDIPNVQYRRQLGLRAGLMFRGAGAPLDEGLGNPMGISGDRPYLSARHNSFSFYGGIALRTISGLVIKTKQYGVETGSSGINIWFADAIVSPVNNFSHPSGDDINDLVREELKGSPIGFRVGYQTHASDRKMISGKSFGFSARGEAGYRPYLGLYVSATIGITIMKIY